MSADVIHGAAQQLAEIAAQTLFTEFLALIGSWDRVAERAPTTSSPRGDE